MQLDFSGRKSYEDTMASSHVNTTLNIENIGKKIFAPPGFLQDGDVVEFVGSQSSGKSSLLQDLMITCLLPKSHGGCNCSVLYFDLDCHLDLLRILSVMEHRTGADEEKLKLWLKNLYVIRCDSTEQTVITLHSVEPLIANSKVAFGMVILDSISSFYWIDANNGKESQYRREVNLCKLVDVLQALKERYRLCILASTQQLVQNPPKSHNCSHFAEYYKPFLCRQWQDFVKYRYVLTVDRQDHSKSQKYVVNCLSHKLPIKHFAVTDHGVTFT